MGANELHEGLSAQSRGRGEARDVERVKREKLHAR
jgi:hypothetical protein